MLLSNAILMTKARESLKGKWGLAVGAYFVLLLLPAIVQAVPRIGLIASLIINGPFILGMTILSLNISRNQKVEFRQIFKGFERFETAVGAFFLSTIFILLWTLLLIVPGIIAALSYSMLFFILADDKTIGIMDALKKSKSMMQGYKWKYFCLQFRLFPLAILCIFTFGIGFLWFIPYQQISMAKFYEDVKSNPITVTK